MKLDLQWNHKEDEQFTLFDAQMGDLKLVCNNTHFANFSEMGAGKTLPNALLSKGVIEDNICDYAIIVTPKVVLSDWHDVAYSQCQLQHQVCWLLFSSKGCWSYSGQP